MNELFVLRRNGDDIEGFKQQPSFYSLHGLSTQNTQWITPIQSTSSFSSSLVHTLPPPSSSLPSLMFSSNRAHNKSLLLNLHHLHGLHRRRRLLHDVASLLLHIHQRVHGHVVLPGLLGGGDLDVGRIGGRVLRRQPHDHDGRHQQEIEQIPQSLVHPTPQPRLRASARPYSHWYFQIFAERSKITTLENPISVSVASTTATISRFRSRVKISSFFSCLRSARISMVSMRETKIQKYAIASILP